MHSRKTISFIAVLLATIVAACVFDVYSFTQYSCLECRATRTERRIFVVPVRYVTYEAYSTSVIARDPSHQHQWRWWGSRHSYSLISGTFACGRQHPIWQLPISVQAKYSRLVPASELHQTLQAIDSPDRKTADAAINRVYECVTDAP